MDVVERLGRAAENIVLALPRWAYRRIVVAERRREAAKADVRAVRDALLTADRIQAIRYGTDAALAEPRAAMVRAVGLAASGGDEDLLTLVTAYRDAHDEIIRNWTNSTPAMREALRSTLEAAMRRIAVLQRE